MPEFLLEIGVEEMPASWLPGPHRAARASDSWSSPSREHLRAARRSRRIRRRAGWSLTRPRSRRGRPTARSKVWGPSLKIAQGCGGTLDESRGGVREEERRRPSTSSSRRPRTRPLPASSTSLHVRRTAGRDAREVLPAVIGGPAPRPGLPQAHELGRLARRRQGHVPVRPPHPLDGRPARRRGGALHDLRRRERARRAARSWRAATRPTATASCPAGAAGRPGARRVLRRPPPPPRGAARGRGPRGARGRIIARPSSRRRRARAATTSACSRNGATSWNGPTVVVGRIPDEFRQLPTEVLADRPRAPPEVHPAAAKANTCTRFAALTNADGAGGGRDRARHGAGGGGAPARRARSSSPRT